MRSARTITLAAGLALWAGHASAHAFLKSATPAAGSTVSPGPTEVIIDFTEGVEPLFSTIIVQNASGARLDTGKAHTVGNDTRLAVNVKPLPPGSYTVIWHAVSVNTHKTKGKFIFTVGSK